MRIFITGGSGFLGLTTIKKLVGEGHSVLALARSESSKLAVEGVGASAIIGDILEPTKFAHYLKNIEVVIHCAAPVEFWGPWQKYRTESAEATVSLAKESVKQNVKRFIFISSESVLQDKDPLVNIDESQPTAAKPNSFYGKSKKLAEETLLKLHSSIEIIILRPTFIYGPQCPAIETIIQKVKEGKFIWVNQGHSEFEAVHVENVAAAICSSLTNGKPGSVYLITDDSKATVRTFFEKVFAAKKLKVPTKSLPLSLAKIAASVTEFVWKLFNIKSPPPLSRFELAFVSQPRRYNIDRARRELKYNPKTSGMEESLI